MPYLIDGNNLIGYLPTLKIRSNESRYELISRLIIFQKVKNTRVMVVFDGPPDPNLTEEDFKGIPFFVHYPDFGQNADTVIKKIISKETDLRRFFVVSSDNEIKFYAKSKGAKSLNCQEFNKQLKKALKKYKKIMELEKNVEPPSPLEVKLWSNLFERKK
ncbi:MAG TPA: NYN domain-containing protein [Acidobacteriota bacterium]|nr:NYN domain-containing protein [Acidobacteriota bacterium]